MVQLACTHEGNSEEKNNGTSSSKEISMVQLACTHEGNTEEKNNGYVVFKGNFYGSASLYT